MIEWLELRFQQISYTIKNFSIIGFFLVMFLSNKDNLLKFKEYLLKLNKFEILLITILFLSVIFKFNYMICIGFLL